MNTDVILCAALRPAVELKANHLRFLSRPLLCKFASLGKDGYPHVTPTWFMYDEGKLVVTTPETTVKAENVRRDSRVALLIDDGEKYLMIKGRAHLSATRDPTRDIERLAIRYEGPVRAKETVAELLKERQISVEVVPDKVVSQNV
jgi:PPOX class probable F420-dependent enzyme